MKKKIILWKRPVLAYEGMANFDEKFYVIEAKKGLFENLLKGCSGPEFLKMGQIFYLFIADEENVATYVVLIPIG